MFGGDLFPQASFDKSNLSLPQDYRYCLQLASYAKHFEIAACFSSRSRCMLCCSGKTVDEVWNAIKANQTQPNYEQPFTVGHLLEGMGVVSDSPREPIQAAQLRFLQQFGQSQPEVRQAQVQHARLPDPPQLQIHSQGMTPSFSPAQYAAQQHHLNGRPAMIQQQPLPQQFPQQQYIHPHQQQFQQPAHQSSPQQPSQAPMGQSQQAGGRRARSPTKPQSDKASDSMPVNIRASTQYPPAQQASLPKMIRANGCWLHDSKSHEPARVQLHVHCKRAITHAGSDSMTSPAWDCKKASSMLRQALSESTWVSGCTLKADGTCRPTQNSIALKFE